MVITLDLETTGLDWQSDKIILAGYRIDGKGEVLYDLEAIRKDLSNPDVVLRGHNIKFDALFLANSGFDIQCQLEDTRVLAYLNWPDETSHSLKALVRTRLRLEPKELSDITFKPNKKDLGYLDPRDYYSFTDGKLVRRDLLESYHKDDIINVDKLRAVLKTSEWFTDVEMPLTKMLFEMELYGIPLSSDVLDKLEREYSTERGLLLESLHHQSMGFGYKGEEAFNPDSPAQVGKALEAKGYILDEICDRTAEGAYQVNAPLLKSLSWDGDTFAKDILRYKRLGKLLGTYISRFISDTKRDGKLHGSINQAGSEEDDTSGTNTGRLASSDPNLQNIPSRTKEGRAIRAAFVASDGMYQFVTDLSQIEPRLVAHYSQAKKLIHAYGNNLDTHKLFACDIFGTLTPTETQRFIGKSSWLSTVYGSSYRKLLFICENYSDNPLVLELDKYYPAYDSLPETCDNRCFYGCKKHLAVNVGKKARHIYTQWMYFKNVQDQFKKTNQDIFDWRDNHIARTRRIGYVITIGGRKIEIKGLDSKSFKERSEAERRAVNYLIQGSAADIMKLIMIRFQNEFVRPGLGRVFASVHDEIIGEMKDPKHIEIVKDIMENTVKLRNVQIKASTALTSNWSEKK